jgi:hypothetical protein
MKPLFRPLLIAVLFAAAAPSVGQGVFQATVTLALPPVLPPMAVVRPGVQVVQDLDEEIFFVDGWYWVRRGQYWYRARDHRRAWVYANPRFVPPALIQIAPGQYRHYRKAEWKAGHEERERRREWREEERERRRAEKRSEKEWKKEHKPRHRDHED